MHGMQQQNLVRNLPWDSSGPYTRMSCFEALIRMAQEIRNFFPTKGGQTELEHVWVILEGSLFWIFRRGT